MSNSNETDGDALLQGEVKASYFWDDGSGIAGDTGKPASGEPMQEGLFASPSWPLGTEGYITYEGQKVEFFIGDRGPGEPSHGCDVLLDLDAKTFAELTGGNWNETTYWVDGVSTGHIDVSYTITEWGDGAGEEGAPHPFGQESQRCENAVSDVAAEDSGAQEEAEGSGGESSDEEGSGGEDSSAESRTEERSDSGGSDGQGAQSRTGEAREEGSTGDGGGQPASQERSGDDAAGEQRSTSQEEDDGGTGAASDGSSGGERSDATETATESQPALETVAYDSPMAVGALTVLLVAVLAVTVTVVTRQWMPAGSSGRHRKPQVFAQLAERVRAALHTRRSRR